MITLDQIKTDIHTGKSMLIYYSCRTLWWTHLDTDLKDSTIHGRESQKIAHEVYMSSDWIPKQERDRTHTLFTKLMSENFTRTPLDPSGCPLFQMEDPKKWILGAEQKPGHFGKHGLDAFIKAHHQNCANHCFASWVECNSVIDHGIKNIVN